MHAESTSPSIASASRRAVSALACRRVFGALPRNGTTISTIVGRLQPVPSAPDNASIAARLEAFAALLDLAGASYYTARAYRRAAETIRETRAPVAKMVRDGSIRSLRGIGPGIEARLRELVETGDIAELRELEREVDPELVGLGRFLGLSPKRAVEIGRTLGIRTAEEFRAAAAEGRLRDVPGIGAATEAKLLERLGREEAPRAARPLLLSRARALLESVAAALGGEIAGDPRRWRDENERLGVVVAAELAKPVLDAFAELPAIVAVVEREERRAVGATVEGVPVELVVAEPAQFGRELVRATGSEAYLSGLAPFRVLRGTECDIRADGSLDLPDDVLSELDWVQLSLHAGQRAPREELTRKVTDAMRNPAVRCLSHPKGRIINHRPENAIDLDAIFEVALETGVVL